jgi:hypothetical protein
MRMNFMPMYHFPASRTGVRLNLVIHPALHADFFHEEQIINNILMMHNAIYHVYGDEICKALARKIAALITAGYSFFLCT